MLLLNLLFLLLSDFNSIKVRLELDKSSFELY